ncbi:hypothetical protein Bbelb_187390 [Branchiostoma belcheri]|nr:hypothetical protein Bbelb_187390 [Branchiostoma belcheri]
MGKRRPSNLALVHIHYDNTLESKLVFRATRALCPLVQITATVKSSPGGVWLAGQTKSYTWLECTVNHNQLFPAVWDAAAHLKGIGLHVRAFVSDGASPNRRDSGSSFLEVLFQDWMREGTVIRLDVRHWLHRWDAVVIKQSHAKYWTFMSALAGAVLAYKRDDMMLLVRAVRNGDPDSYPKCSDEEMISFVKPHQIKPYVRRITRAQVCGGSRRILGNCKQASQLHLVHVPKPRKTARESTPSTSRKRAKLMQGVRGQLSGGDSAALMREELRFYTRDELQRMLKELHLDRVCIPTGHLLAAKTANYMSPNELRRIGYDLHRHSVRCWDIQRKKGDDTKYLDKRDHKGHILPPLLEMEYHHVVPDVLHMVVVWAINQRRTDELVAAMKETGVPFRILEGVGDDGKGSVKTWTSLNAKQVEEVFAKLDLKADRWNPRGLSVHSLSVARLKVELEKRGLDNRAQVAEVADKLAGIAVPFGDIKLTVPDVVDILVIQKNCLSRHNGPTTWSMTRLEEKGIKRGEGGPVGRKATLVQRLVQELGSDEIPLPPDEETDEDNLILLVDNIVSLWEVMEYENRALFGILHNLNREKACLGPNSASRRAGLQATRVDISDVLLEEFRWADNARPRRPGESLSVYAADVQRLFRLAYTAYNDAGWAHVAMDRLLTGLDPNLRNRVMEFGLASICEQARPYLGRRPTAEAIAATTTLPLARRTTAGRHASPYEQCRRCNGYGHQFNSWF